MANRNGPIIEEFRSHKGQVGGFFEGKPVLLLSTTGARTGRRHVNPAMYLPDGDRWVVFASMGGAPKHPDWYHTLVANPAVTVEVGTETFEGRAEVITGDERDRLYARQVQLYPQFADYEKQTIRTIPVIALSRVQG